jgi:peroxin-2
VQTDYAPEILLALRALLFKLTVWDQNASYGASLQGLRFTDARVGGPSSPLPSKWQKAFYGIFTVFGRYGWTKWESYLADQEGGYEPPPPLIKRLSHLTSTLTTVHGIVGLASFLTFLVNGRYRTILDRFLRLRLVPSSTLTGRDISFEYLNRQLVWHAFTEFLLFILPIVGISRWRRILGRSWKRLSTYLRDLFGIKTDSSVLKKDGEFKFLPERTCAICYSDQNPVIGLGGEGDIAAATSGGGVVGSSQTDITNPYEAIPCGCVYCFVCLAERLEAEEGEGWTCLRCGTVAMECKPWNGDVLEEHHKIGGKSVGFFDLHRGTDAPLTPATSDVTMRDVEPIPTEDDIETIDEEIEPMLHPDVNESEEWARASGVVDSQDTEESSGSASYDSEEDDLLHRSRKY